MCGSKKFSNKRVNFSQVTPYPSSILPNYELTIPTSLPLYLILACHESEVGIVIIACSLVILVMGMGLLD